MAKETKKTWWDKMEQVYVALCKKYGVPEEPIVFHTYTRRYHFDYTYKKYYTMQQISQQYEVYKGKLDEPVLPVTEKQMQLIEKLAANDEKEIIERIELNRVNASYVIKILMASESAIYNRYSTYEDFVYYHNELVKMQTPAHQ